MDCLFDLEQKRKEQKVLNRGWMKGQGETGRGGSKERERREREGKEGREKNKGVFTCLWNQQLAALSHNFRHMDIIRMTVCVCVCP